jgi:hypothetical protein
MIVCGNCADAVELSEDQDQDPKWVHVIPYYLDEPEYCAPRMAVVVQSKPATSEVEIPPWAVVVGMICITFIAALLIIKYG